MATTRDQAWQQYQDIYRNAGAGDLLEGDYEAEAGREFGDWWKHASESGELQGVDNKGTGTSWADLVPDLTTRVSARTAERTPGVVQPDSNAPAGQQNSVASAWTSQTATPTATPATPATPDPRRSAMFDSLLARIRENSGTASADNPIVRAQADAYAAQEERSRRDYLADLAEREGPLANLRGEQRMGYERRGQRVGAFQAELMAREQMAMRDQLKTAYDQAIRMLDFESAEALQREMAAIDQQLRGRQLDQSQDQFLRELGLREWDLLNRNDLIRRGL